LLCTFAILSVLLTSCVSNTVISTESSSPQNKEMETDSSQVKITELMSEISKQNQEIEILKEAILNPSMIDSNIHSYQGLFWGSVEHQQFSNYFKSFAKRVLFDFDYIWIEEIPYKENPIEDIKKTEDKKNQLFGIIYNSPINSSVTSFPPQIIESWFNTNEKNNYLYLKTNDNEWHSYKVLDGHLLGDYRILSTLLTLVDEINNEPA
jgi:hypothetical protein